MNTVWQVRFTGRITNAPLSRSVAIAARGFPSIVETGGDVTWTFYTLAGGEKEARALVVGQARQSGITIASILDATDTGVATSNQPAPRLAVAVKKEEKKHA